MLQGTFTHQVSWNIVGSNKGRRMQKKTRFKHGNNLQSSQNVKIKLIPLNLNIGPSACLKLLRFLKIIPRERSRFYPTPSFQVK